MTLSKLPKHRYKTPNESDIPAIYHKVNELIGNSNTADEATPLVYKCLLTQSGGDAPVATILANTLGGTIVWTRVVAGSYLGTLTGAFPVQAKVILRQPPNWTGDANLVRPYIGIGWNDANSIYLQTCDLKAAGADADDLLNSTSIEIEVYS